MPSTDAVPTDFLEPGQTAVVSLDGFPIAIGNVEGTHHAFQHLCPHQGTALGGRPLDGFDQDLMTFAVRVVEDVVQVDV